MKHVCKQNTDHDPIVYLNDDGDAGCENHIIATVTSYGFCGAGYYLIVAEEYMVRVMFCPFCGERMSTYSTIDESAEIRELIVDCEHLISKHGDDFALWQSLESLRARERNLMAQHDSKV